MRNNLETNLLIAKLNSHPEKCLYTTSLYEPTNSIIVKKFFLNIEGDYELDYEMFVPKHKIVRFLKDLLGTNVQLATIRE